MIKDADFNFFPAIYVVCRYTDMRFGADSLAAITESKYKANILTPNSLFPICRRFSIKVKSLI